MEERKLSREYIAESAIELISKYPVDQVTVTQIAKNCKTSTRTFYNYFQDKYDLYLWIYTHYLVEYFDDPPEHVGFRSFLMFCGNTLYRHKDFFIHLFKYQGQNNFQDALVQPLVEYHKLIIEEYFGDSVSEYDEIVLEFFLFGVMEYVARSFRSGNPQDVPSAVDVFIAALPERFLKYE